MDDEWISKKEAAARITLRTNLQDPEGLLDDAVLEGKIRIDRPPMVGVSEAIRGDLNLYAGGFTAVDAEYDERLGGVLRPLGRVNLRDLNAWINNLFGERPKTKTQASRPGKKGPVLAIYADLYPDGHNAAGVFTNAAQRAVIEEFQRRHKDTVSPRLVAQVFALAKLQNR